MAFAVVERFKQEVMYGLSAGTKERCRCEEFAVSGGSTVSLDEGLFHQGRMYTYSCSTISD